ncbi:MAG: hypothetical protein KC549_07435 [Myxococcales bacterium]|nr:hypothetical protein [Myxococcales bacterium]
MLRALLLLLCLPLAACDECAEDYDCPATKVCRAGACATAACTSDRACPPGRRCASGKCAETPALAAPPGMDAVILRVADAGT